MQIISLHTFSILNALLAMKYQNMLRLISVVAFVMLAVTSFAQNGGTLSGNVTDNYYVEGLAFTTINVKSDDKTIATGYTDADGFYIIKSLPPGIYDVEISALKYGKTLTQDIKIEKGKTTILNKVLSLNTGIDPNGFHSHIFSNDVISFGSHGVQKL
jgi:hypothetical protein